MHILVRYQVTSSVDSRTAFCSHRCLLSHASMSMTHHNIDTHQYGTSGRTIWKCIPICQQLSDWGDTQKQMLTAGCDFGTWLGTKLFEKQVTKTSSNDWWKKTGQTHSAPESACCRGHPPPPRRPGYMGAAKLWEPQLQLPFGGQSNNANQ